MATVLLVVHLMIAAALVGVVLLQRSEGARSALAAVAAAVPHRARHGGEPAHQGDGDARGGVLPDQHHADGPAQRRSGRLGVRPGGAAGQRRPRGRRHRRRHAGAAGGPRRHPRQAAGCPSGPAVPQTRNSRPRAGDPAPTRRGPARPVLSSNAAGDEAIKRFESHRRCATSKVHAAVHLHYRRRGLLLGKGLASAALGALLQARGYAVRLRKLDPYLNVDPGR